MQLLLLFCLVLNSVSSDTSNYVQDFVTGSEQFAANLYMQIKKTNNSNFLVSPVSVQIILALAGIGANEETVEELSKVLHIPRDGKNIEKVFQVVTKNMENTGESISAIANKIYVKDGLEINTAKIESANKYFNTKIEYINFLSKNAVSKINNWVEENTQDSDMMLPDSFNDKTKCILINLMYFNGAWAYPFKERDTKTKNFFINAKETKQIPIMLTIGKFNYAYNEHLKAQFINLPYKGSDMSMTIVLPDEIDGLSKLELNISDVFENQTYHQPNVTLQIPKFNEKSKSDLKEALQNMGVQKLLEDTDELGGLTISNVFQEAIMIVDEQDGAIPKPKLVKQIVEIFVDFNANHPFMYYIKSVSTGIIFIGRFVTP